MIDPCPICGERRCPPKTKVEDQANDFDAALYRLIYRAAAYAFAGSRETEESKRWGAVHKALQDARPYVREMMSAHDREVTR
jgi:hypothetical protein